MREETLPHIWCAGCGHGIILNAILSAIDKLQLDKNKVAVVSGIGCASRAPGYVDFNTLHTTHGRALPFATGIKLARPELTVIVISGDGDAAAIGGNHLIHAARRNIDLALVVFNNETYGMTSGQYSPTTPTGMLGTTAPYGSPERAFDICKLAEAAGATYVARGTAYHSRVLPNLIEKAVRNKGFSVVETISQCPTYFGRMNKMGNAVDMLMWQRDHAISKKEYDSLSPEEVGDRFPIGELYNKPEADFIKRYQAIREAAVARAESGK